MSGGIGFTPAVDRKPAVLGGPLRVVQVSQITAAGTTTVTVPTGASVCDAFARGAGGSASAGNVRSGGGGAEEFVSFAVSPGTPITVVAGAAAVGTAGSSTVSYGGKVLVSAAGGNGGGLDSAGGVASASGYSGANGVTGASASGGNSGAFVGPGAGGFGGSSGTALNGRYGGGGALGGGVAGAGGDGLIALIFRG